MNAPHISIDVSAAGVSVRQQRPNVAPLLKGLPVDEALLQIPILLPICGQAQAIAARRALCAAQQKQDAHIEAHALALCREQALAAAWRLAIDWPALIEHERRLDLLKQVQDTDEPKALAQHLLAFVPGLQAVDSQDALRDWIASADCTAAEVIRHAQRCERGMHTPERRCIKDEALVDLARRCLMHRAFDPLTVEHDGVDVGPLALQRNALLKALEAAPLSQRLLAQLLDTLSIATQLLETPTPAPSSWALPENMGIGQAMTARGPVFHRIALQDGDTVQDWRVVAPTDWHFSPSGPFLREAQACTNREQLSLLAAGFDPCAPWTVEARRRA